MLKEPRRLQLAFSVLREVHSNIVQLITIDAAIYTFQFQSDTIQQKCSILSCGELHIEWEFKTHILMDTLHSLHSTLPWNEQTYERRKLGKLY